MDKLCELPPFEFENWAAIAIGGIPNKARVGDMGIDGRIYPVLASPKWREGELEFMDVWYPIQVKPEMTGTRKIRYLQSFGLAV
jgi:hypothetical protein